MSLINPERINKFGKPVGVENIIKHREDGIEDWDATIRFENNNCCLLHQFLSNVPDYISWKYIKAALIEIGIKLPNRKDLKCDFYTQDATYYRI